MGEIFHEMAYGDKIQMHKYNIYRQYSELKFLKKKLKANEVILSLDFWKNYDNKQSYQIQSAYLGHECFTIFTAACNFSSIVGIPGNSKIARESGLKVVPITIVSNEIQHDGNVGFTNNNKLIEMIFEICSSIKTFHFWANGCSGQFRSKYVFPSFCYYPTSIKLTWNYGEAHHFKGIYLYIPLIKMFSAEHCKIIFVTLINNKVCVCVCVCERERERERERSLSYHLVMFKLELSICLSHSELK